MNGRVWRFRAYIYITFSLSTATSVCTRLLAPLSIHLHVSGVLIHHYLNNLLIKAPLRTLCQTWTQTIYNILTLLYRRGLGVNREKSEVVPSQDFVYIRVRFQTLKGISLLPPTISAPCIQKRSHPSGLQIHPLPRFSCPCTETWAR